MDIEKELLDYNHGKSRGAAKKLADKLNISPSAMSQILDGRMKIPKDLRALISKELKIPPAQLPERFPQRDQRNAAAHGTRDTSAIYHAPELQPITGMRPVQVPFFGPACAGNRSFSFDAVPESWETEWVVLPTGRRVGAWKVTGECMDDNTPQAIHEGDTIWVLEQKTAESGDIVVALLNGAITIKELKHYNDIIELKPRNPKHKPISVKKDDTFEILGVVWKSIHNHRKR